MNIGKIKYKPEIICIPLPREPFLLQEITQNNYSKNNLNDKQNKFQSIHLQWNSKAPDFEIDNANSTAYHPNKSHAIQRMILPYNIELHCFNTLINQS